MTVPPPGSPVVTPDPPALLNGIRSRPGAYGLDGSYKSYVTFLNGYHEGSGRRALAGFREWLADRLGSGTNLVWEALVLRLAFRDDFPGQVRHPRELTPNEDIAATSRLFQLLAEFQESDAAAGHSTIVTGWIRESNVRPFCESLADDDRRPETWYTYPFVGRHSIDLRIAQAVGGSVTSVEISGITTLTLHAGLAALVAVMARPSPAPDQGGFTKGTVWV